MSSQIKKITIILGDVSAKGAGRWEGGSTRPFILARGLSRAGFEVDFVGFNWEGDCSRKELGGFPLSEIRGRAFPFLLFTLVLNLKLIKGDMIYAYKPQVCSFGFALLKRFFSKKPVVLDVDDWELSWHGGDDWKYQPSFKQLVLDLIKTRGGLRDPYFPSYVKKMESYIPQANKVTTHNTFLQSRFGGELVANAKDTEHFDPSKYDISHSKKKYSLDNFVSLMFAGAPRPYKGVEDLLEAMEILARDDLRLVIVGGSPYDDYDSYLNDKWGRWIIRIPAKTYFEMPEVISAADIVVVPQRDSDETRAQFPLKLMDAMSMAKPFLTTRVGDIPEIIGETGFLVEPGSASQLADKISWILDHPDEAKAKAVLARKRCKEFYSLDRASSDLANIVKSL